MANWIGGVSTRQVDELVQAPGLTGISKGTVSKLCMGEARADARTDVKPTLAWVLEAILQGCPRALDRERWLKCLRPAYRRAPPSARLPPSQASTQPDRDSAGQTCRHVADQVRARWPKLAALIKEIEADVLAYMSSPSQHRTKLHSTNPLERLNDEVKRRADLVGIFQNQETIIRLIGAVLFEQNDKWLGQHRSMQIVAFAQIDSTDRDPLLRIGQRGRPLPPYQAGRLGDALSRSLRILHHRDGRDQGGAGPVRAPPLTLLRRKGGRAVEGTGLENQQAGNRLVGSNPTPSATFLVISVT